MMIRSWGDQMESVVIYGQQKIAQRNIWIHKKKTSIGGDGDDMFFGWKKQKKIAGSWVLHGFCLSHWRFPHPQRHPVRLVAGSLLDSKTYDFFGGS